MTIDHGPIDTCDFLGRPLAVGDTIIIERQGILDWAVITKYNPDTRQIHLEKQIVHNNVEQKSYRFHTPFYAGRVYKVKEL